MAERRTIKHKPWTELLPPYVIADRQSILAIYYSGSARDSRILARSVMEENMILFAKNPTLYPWLKDVVDNAIQSPERSAPSVDWVEWAREVFDKHADPYKPRHALIRLDGLLTTNSNNYQPRHLQPITNPPATVRIHDYHNYVDL